MLVTRIEDETFERKGQEIVLSDFVMSLEGPLCGYVTFSTGNMDTLVRSRVGTSAGDERERRRK